MADEEIRQIVKETVETFSWMLRYRDGIYVIERICEKIIRYRLGL